ncbi:MAG: hypothetical protein WHT82_10560, partial [Limisphaera sp.]
MWLDFSVLQTPPMLASFSGLLNNGKTPHSGPAGPRLPACADAAGDIPPKQPLANSFPPKAVKGRNPAGAAYGC